MDDPSRCGAAPSQARPPPRNRKRNRRRHRRPRGDAPPAEQAHAPHQPHRNRPQLVTTVDADTLVYLDARVAVARAKGKELNRGSAIDELVRRAGGEDRERAWEESVLRHGARGQIDVTQRWLAVLSRGCDEGVRREGFAAIQAALRALDGLLPAKRGPVAAPLPPEYQI